MNIEEQCYLDYENSVTRISRSMCVPMRVIHLAGSLTKEYFLEDDVSKRKKILIACTLSRISNRSLKKELLYQRERSIIRVFKDDKYEDDIIHMISYISYHHNLDVDFTRIEKWKLIPRMAYLQFIVSPQELLRIYDDYCKKLLPLFVASTPLCVTQEEVMSHVTRKRYNAYVSRGFKSVSMVDFYYDKLFHIFNEDVGFSSDGSSDERGGSVPFGFSKVATFGIAINCSLLRNDYKKCSTFIETVMSTLRNNC